ncbi:MAG: dihydrodipicolinate synthase family protein [Beijerinckiaceae bacterium]
MAITAATLSRSVLSVPPLARSADLSLSAAGNRAQCDHLRAGGVTSFLWGGNANLYNMGVMEFAPFLDMLDGIAHPGDWHIPSVGADFGKAIDQAKLLKGRSAFPTAMLLPLRFPATADGIAEGMARIADAMGKPIIAYVKDDGYVEAAALGRMVRSGHICAVKYGTVKATPANDPALRAIVDSVDPTLVISGIGERPVIDHFTGFRIRSFTSGCVCIAPRLSMDILAALTRGDVKSAAAIREAFMVLEDLRDAHSPLRVLHEAVRLSGVAPTGPMLPMLSSITDAEVLAKIEVAAKALLQANMAALQQKAA